MMTNPTSVAPHAASLPRAGRAVFAVALSLASALAGSEAAAADLTILVAPKDGPIATRPDEAGTVVVPRLFLAFERASEHLSTCQRCVVTIKVVGGAQTGRAEVGQWVFPETVAPGATLRVLGGYDAKLERRAPFSHPTVLVTSRPRSGTVLEFQGRRTAFAELYFSGFAIDVAPGNNYDAKTGALMKGGSPSWPIVAFGMMKVDRLTIADNIFVNAANAVGGPRITASADSEVVVRNNFFLNNVHAWQVTGLPRTPVLPRYVVQGNSFIRNFPYNPDPTTSNPGAIEIGGKDGVARVELRGNLFAFNSGGAIFPQWDEKRGPQIEIADNLFFRNAGIFGAKDVGKGAVVGKFNGAAKHGVFTPDEVAEEFSWKSHGNVVADPGIDLGSAVREPAGADAQPGPDEDGEIEVVRSADIDNFATRYELSFDRLPFPKAAGTNKFGASPARVVTP